MEIPPPIRKLRPHGAAEIGPPVVRLSAVFLPSKVEVSCFLTVRVLLRLYKPLVFVGTVVDHKIQDHLHAPFSRLGQKPVHVVIRAKHRVYLIVIRDIISVIIHGRTIHRADPDHIHSQFL